MTQTITTTPATNMHREDLGTEAGSYVVEFCKVAATTPKAKRVNAVIVKDETGANPRMVTMWLDLDEALPTPKSTIFAFIERSRVTNLQNGRTYDNADVRTWSFS